jgi:hypothetical protein
MLTLGAAESLKVKLLPSVTAADAESSDDPHADAGSCIFCMASGCRVLILLVIHRPLQEEMRMNYTGKNELFALQEPQQCR